VLVEPFVRSAERCVLAATTDSTAVVSLASIDCDLPVAEVYRKVVFPAGAEAAGPDVNGDNPAP